MEGSQWRKVLRNIAIEVLAYSILVVVYFILILQFLADPLKSLFDNNLAVYALVSLVLIVAQGAILEVLTSFLLNRLGLERLG